MDEPKITINPGRYRSCLYAVQFIFISSGYINLFIRLNFFFSQGRDEGLIQE